jgi:hypothetical protein
VRAKVARGVSCWHGRGGCRMGGLYRPARGQCEARWKGGPALLPLRQLRDLQAHGCLCGRKRRFPGGGYWIGFPCKGQRRRQIDVPWPVKSLWPAGAHRSSAVELEPRDWFRVRAVPCYILDTRVTSVIVLVHWMLSFAFYGLHGSLDYPHL